MDPNKVAKEHLMDQFSNRLTALEEWKNAIDKRLTDLFDDPDPRVSQRARALMYQTHPQTIPEQRNCVRCGRLHLIRHSDDCVYCGKEVPR